MVLRRLPDQARPFEVQAIGAAPVAADPVDRRHPLVALNIDPDLEKERGFAASALHREARAADAALRASELPSPMITQRQRDPPSTADERQAGGLAVKAEDRLVVLHGSVSIIVEAAARGLCGRRLLRRLRRALDGLGLTIREMMHVHMTLFSHVRGLALNLEAEAQAEQDSGLTSDEWMQTQEHGFRVIAGTGDFPLLNRLVNSDMELDLDQLFEFGLGRLLDGLERHLAGR